MADRNNSGLNPIVAVLIAIVIVGGIIGAYLWTTWTGPVHAGQVVSVTVYPIHRELSTGAEMGGITGSPNTYDEVIVLANVKIRSTTKLPLFLNNMWGDLTLHNGATQRNLAVNNVEFRDVFAAYPKLKPAEGHPMPWNVTLQPGQELDGQLIFHFPVTAQQWDSRQSFEVSLQFLHQPDLTMAATPSETTTLQ